MRRFHICNPLVVGILWLFMSSSVLGGAQAPAGAVAEAAGEAGPAEERWYVLELGGERAGWLVERWWSEGERRVTELESEFRLARGEAPLEIVLAGRFVETAAGEPVSLRTRRSLGSEPVETTYRFLPGRVEAETVQGGRTRRETVDPPAGEWLTPARARDAAARHHRAGDGSYRLRTIDPLEGLEPVTVTRTRLDEAPAAPGAVGRWREELSSAPGVPTVVELDARGEVIWSRSELLGLEAILRRSDRDTALAATEGPGPEVLLATLVRPDRPIPEPARARRAVFELSRAVADGGPAQGAPPDLPALDALPDGGAQRVERRGDRVRVTVAVPEDGAGPDGTVRPPPADRDGGSGLDPFLAASTYLDHDAPEVRRLLAHLHPEDADPGAAPGAGAAGLARSLTDLVRRHVAVKDLDTGFATASEVARTGSGDCTEHAVLLAALLRAAGIASRVVTGLVYLEDAAGLGEEARGAFGYHMWTQALVDGGWLDLDATLPGGFDATHIALGASPLAGPEGGR
ncbi:MAG TPA: transglutaminase domain-containing protein, partial [Thermoanaerobaculia bacterium]